MAADRQCELITRKWYHGRIYSAGGHWTLAHRRWLSSQKFEAYHSRLKEWMRRFHGVATKNLPSYLSWRRTIDALSTVTVRVDQIRVCGVTAFARRARVKFHVLPAPGAPKPEAPDLHINNRARWRAPVGLRRRCRH